MSEVDSPTAPTRPTPSSAVTVTTTADPAPRPGPRRVRLTVSRVDPWSAMKVSFLVSVGLGVAIVVMITVLWMLLSGMGVYDQINTMVNKIIGDNETKFDLLDFVGFGRVVSLSVVIGVINVLLLTALATLGAFLYNICASLVGGLQTTLTDE
ncbi:MAG: DUF3566 domain-containing protein [Tetrasphaera sp.]